jgi:hypothetical protein
LATGPGQYPIDKFAACLSRKLGGFFAADPGCPQRGRRETVGSGKSLAILCAKLEDVEYLNSSPGPDDARYMKCTGEITIRPAETLQASAGGSIINVFTNEAGTLRVGAAGRPSPFSAAPLVAKKPPFKPMSREVAGSGVEDFKLKLAGKAKRKLKQNHRLKLKVAIAFIPLGGGEAVSRTEKVVLTSPCKPTKKSLC